MASELLTAAESGDLTEVKRLLNEDGVSVKVTNKAGYTVLLWSCLYGMLPIVKWLLSKEGGSSIDEVNKRGMTALLLAAMHGRENTLQWLLSEEGGASIEEKSNAGHTALLLGAWNGQLTVVQWLLEHGGADITNTTSTGGDTVWELLEVYLLAPADNLPAGIATVKALLQVMSLRGAPPGKLVDQLLPELTKVVQEGARLRVGLPAYLAHRRALLDEHCPLLPPLQALVYGYERPTTTEELWATLPALGPVPETIGINIPPPATDFHFADVSQEKGMI
jgi:hypothetical protein